MLLTVDLDRDTIRLDVDGELLAVRPRSAAFQLRHLMTAPDEAEYATLARRVELSVVPERGHNQRVDLLYVPPTGQLGDVLALYDQGGQLIASSGTARGMHYLQYLTS